MNSAVRSILEGVRERSADMCYVAFASINDTNELGDNALHCVCRWGDVAAAKVLVENGINVNQIGEMGETPLDVAETNAPESLVTFLLQHGATPGPEAVRGRFDHEKHARHIQRLGEDIEKLEQSIKQNCEPEE